MTRHTWAVVAVACLSLPTGLALADDSPPYVDTDARGTLTLCDDHGHEVRSGYVGEIPMVAAAISSARPPSPYDKGTDAGTVRERPAAVLFAAQPRQGYPPGDWSGLPLGGSSLFTNADHPVALLSRGDYTLRQFLVAFPARWDGYVELRMRFKAPQQPVSDQYAAADIRVTGDVWRMVRGGGTPCTVGSATSVEKLLVPRAFAGGNKPSSGPDSLPAGLALARAATQSPPRPGQTSIPAPVASALPSGATAPLAAGSPGTSTSATPQAADRRNGSSSPGALAALGVIVIGGLGGLAWWSGRRRVNSA